MAITPWDWNASNGTATASQTRAAYNALITQGSTTSFSRYVWNDLVSKVNEVVRALNRTWNAQHTTMSGAKANYLYSNLTAAMFNSVRLNTNYPSWRWQYDAVRTWYIGRTDVRGVSSFGDSGADIVYGAYILELAEKLNTVIGIINGTQNVEELAEVLPLLLAPDAEVTSPAGLVLPYMRNRELLTPHALLQSENLPTMTLHFEIPTAVIRAYLEAEELSSMIEGYAYITTNTEAKLNRIHSVLLSQMIPSRVQYAALLRMLENAHLSADAGQCIGGTAEAVSFPSSVLKQHTPERLSVSGSAVSKSSAPVGWTHYRVRFEPDAELSMEMNKIMIAVGTQSGVLHGILTRGSPVRMAVDCDLSESLTSRAVTEEGTPHLLTIHHDVSSVESGANLGTAQYMNGLDASLELSPLTHSATLAFEHISTMLIAYLRAAMSSSASVSYYRTAPVEREIDITVEITADAVADYAPLLEKAVEITLGIGSELHSAVAGECEHHARFSVEPIGQLRSGFAPYLGEIRHNYRLDVPADIVKCRSERAVSHLRTGISFEGFPHVCPVEGGLLAPLDFRYPQVLGNLAAKESIRLPAASGTQSHLTEAALTYINGILSASADAQISLIPGSDLGYVFCADLTGNTAVAVVLQADVDTEGGGWQYPVIVDTDAAVFQVWLTEQNRKHLFLDPLQSVHHAEITHGISGSVDRQIRVGVEAESSHFVSVSGELHKRQRGDWEYPVLSEGVMLVTQAIDALPHYQFNLEVR